MGFSLRASVSIFHWHSLRRAAGAGLNRCWRRQLPVLAPPAATKDGLSRPAAGGPVRGEPAGAGRRGMSGSTGVVAAFLRVALLVVAVSLVWCAHYERWTLASWSIPIEYRGDAPETLAQIRAAADGDLRPLSPRVIERLGAPFGAAWNSYPTPDKPWLLLAGALSHVCGLFAAANLVMLLATITAALAFYLVARWLRCRWEWAWAGAVCFAFTYHTFHRGLGHFSLGFTWTVPFGLLAVWLVARSTRLAWRSAGAAVCLGAPIALGLSNPYNLLFWLQLMSWAVIGQWLHERRPANLAIGVTAITLAILTFVASHLEVWVFAEEPEGAPVISRNYAGTEIYALKPVEMFVPPVFHRLPSLSALGERYVRSSEWRGEAFLPYLGLIGIASLLWLAVLTARAVFLRRPLPGQAQSIGWLVAYASIGGVTNVLALVAGFHVFRATNRVAIFISAILLFFAVVRLSRFTVRWPAWSRVGLALGLAGLGVLDQVPRSETPDVRAEIARSVESDRKLGAVLEAELPAGAMVFQLPILGFPEVAAPHRLADYELFRPYLVTETLRFSYGVAKSRARGRWQHDLENASTATLVRRIESYGFAALYLNRKGFEDRAEGRLRELAALGYRRTLEGSGGDQVVVLLNPNPVPESPLGRTFTFGRGWHPRSLDGVRWANANAVLSYYNPYPHPVNAQLAFSLSGVSDREVTVVHQGRERVRVRVGESPRRVRIPDVPLVPGVNVFQIRSDQPAIRIGNGRYSLRTFGLQDAAIKFAKPDGDTE